MADREEGGVAPNQGRNTTNNKIKNQLNSNIYI